VVTDTNYARSERSELCDLFLALGPDQPTLCAGWVTQDLAAHLVVRERRFDASPGIMLKPLAGHLAKVQARYAQLPYQELIGLVRNPPAWSPLAMGPVDRLTNTNEFFIHHEDVRRAQPDWIPRPLPEAHLAALWTRVPVAARFGLRKFPAAVVVTAPGHGEARAGDKQGPEVRLSADPAELTLFLGGRQAAAQVDLTGPDELVGRLRGARLGV
jgi:uncharacterized protein (TIGR03085 family)